MRLNTMVITKRLMHLRKSIAAVLCLILVFPLTSFAEKSVDLYNISQLVLDQSVGLRQQATSSGLATVLVRVSGNQQVLQHPIVKEAISRANTYLSQYSYGSTDEMITIAGDSRPARRLFLQFSEFAIQRLLKTSQLPTWLARRPEVLFWLASDSQRQRLLLEAESLEVIAFKEAASTRGLPIATPLLDLQDRNALSPVRLWAMDEVAIRNASARYGLDAILAGRIKPVSDVSWQGNFILIHKAKRFYFNGSGISSQAVAKQVIDQVTNYLASLDAIIVNNENSAPSITIAVANITSFAAYASLLNYLDDLPFVAGTMVSRVDADQVMLTLSYNGSVEKLLSVLASSDLMQEVATSISSSDTTAAASFSWR